MSFLVGGGHPREKGLPPPSRGGDRESETTPRKRENATNTTPDGEREREGALPQKKKHTAHPKGKKQRETPRKERKRTLLAVSRHGRA